MPLEIRVEPEVVAYDYRGSTGIVLSNFGSEPFNVRQGQCVAQVVLEEQNTFANIRVDDCLHLPGNRQALS
eukprot:3606778-Karenia_brevis.AAC.1